RGERLLGPDEASPTIEFGRQSGLDLPARRMGTQLGIKVGQGRGRHDGLRECRDPADEVRAALEIELGEDVVEQQQWWPPVECGQQVELRELERQDGRPLLAA